MLCRKRYPARSQSQLAAQDEEYQKELPRGPWPCDLDLLEVAHFMSHGHIRSVDHGSYMGRTPSPSREESIVQRRRLLPFSLMLHKVGSCFTASASAHTLSTVTDVL